jgi:cytoskeletal protein RodZ
MPTVGAELKQARERLGLSAEQIEQRTKIHLHRIDALERADFTQLPDGIYLDGLVRAYAEEVALAPEPLILRVRAERAKVLFGDIDAFLREEDGSESLPRPVERVQASAPPPRPAHNILAEDDEPYSGLAFEIEAAAARAGLTPVRRERRGSRFALPLAALLALAGWSAYFYEISRRPASQTAVDSSSARSDETANKAGATVGDTPSPAADVSRFPDATAGAAPPGSAGTAGTPAAPPPSPPVAPNSLDAPPRPSTTAENAVPTAGALPVAPTRNVSGDWRLATHVESSTYEDFKGLSLGYEITLHQVGDRITGAGRKITENGAAIDSKAQTPISLTGTIAGDRLSLTFTESGAQRVTQGKFVLLVDEGGTLRGRFSSTAAQSSGRVEGRRF